jgi:hypothetical protein
VHRFLPSVRRMLEREGFKPKRTKQFVARPGRQMRVHRLNVSGAVSTPRSVRQGIRNRVFLLERWAGMAPWDATVEAQFVRLSSTVGHLKQTNPGDHRRLQARLRRLGPLRAAFAVARSALSQVARK